MEKYLNKNSRTWVYFKFVNGQAINISEQEAGKIWNQKNKRKWKDVNPPSSIFYTEKGFPYLMIGNLM